MKKIIISKHDLYLISMVFLFMLVVLLVGVSIVAAQDTQPPGPDVPDGSAAPIDNPFQLATTEGDYTVWRKDINSGCSFSDHNYTLDVPENPAIMSDIRYTMTNYDVDYANPACPAGPEVDNMYWNGTMMGRLTGADSAWSLNSWPLTSTMMVNGTNVIRIDTDATNTGCWCVGVGFIEVRAKVGFTVKEFTPQRNDKNRDFHKDKLDLTVTFTSEYDPATLNANTFKLEYRAPLLGLPGPYKAVAGTFTQIAPNRFRFIPSGNLFDGVRYRVTVKSGANGVKSKAGAQLKTDTQWEFWTVPDLSKTDAFNYGSGSVCPPSTSPCQGVELAVFQVARNAQMVPNGKQAVARVYARWLPHSEVYDGDEIKELDVRTTLKVDGQTLITSGRLKRPDQYAAADRNQGINTLNIYHTPRTTFQYSLDVLPNPQTNVTPVKYARTLNLTSTGKSPNIRFDLYFLQAGSWAAGVPAAATTWGRNLMNSGRQYVTDQYPALSTTMDDMGNTSFAYTFTGRTVNAGNCGTVQEVTCGAGGPTTSELQCVYQNMQTMLGGHPFVSAVVPNSLCQNATGFAMGNRVFMLQYGSQANESTVAHEIGHIYGISTANNPNTGHRNDSNGVEGFQVRTRTNRSFVENPTQSMSLMHTTWNTTKWIHNLDYNTLIGTVSFGLEPELAAPTPYLVVSGYIEPGPPAQAQLTSAFLQEAPNSLSDPAGTCTVALLNASDTVLSSGKVTPGVDIEIESQGIAALNNGYFSISLPWNASAAKIRVTCGASSAPDFLRSANAPVVNFITPPYGAILTGVVPIIWAGSDADGNPLQYQLQTSEDNGLSWQPLTALTSTPGINLNTTQLPSGPGRMLRVMASDGFNTTYTTTTVTITNPLLIHSLSPDINASGVGLGSPVEATFFSDLNTTGVNLASMFALKQGSTLVAGKVTYDEASRTLSFTPTQALLPGRVYTATLSNALRDKAGNALPIIVTWSFTTVPDTFAPVVKSIFPAVGATGVELNPRIHVRFDEPINTTALSLNVTDANNAPVAGSLVFLEGNASVLFTPTANLAANQNYQVTISGVQDTAGNTQPAQTQWSFQTGDQVNTAPVKILGNYNEQANDANGDGLFDNLVIFVDVQVDLDSYFNLNAKLIDRFSRLIGWQSTGAIYLVRGVHTIALTFPSVDIRSNGVNGPYVLDSLNFYNYYDLTKSDTEYDAYHTFPYNANEFYSIMALVGLPDKVIEWNVPPVKAFNLRDFTYHETLPASSITYSVFSNSDPNLKVTIDTDGNVFLEPVANTEAESDVTILANDGQGHTASSTFHVSVQKPRVASFTANYKTSMGFSESQRIAVTIYDQWNRVISTQTSVQISATKGVVTPAALQTSSGQFTFTFRAPATPGPVFVTIKSGEVLKILNFNVDHGSIMLPLISNIK